MRHFRLMRLRASIAVVAAAAVLVPTVSAAQRHTFTATYTGHGSGQLNGVQASGQGTAKGRSFLIGRSTLTGSATGRLASASCLSFNGRAVLKGKPGSIKLAARSGQACLAATAVSRVPFSGRARVTGGTKTFAGARGTLRFHGAYATETGTVTITFTGTLTY